MIFASYASIHDTTEARYERNDAVKKLETRVLSFLFLAIFPRLCAATWELISPPAPSTLMAPKSDSAEGLSLSLSLSSATVKFWLLISLAMATGMSSLT